MAPKRRSLSYLAKHLVQQRHAVLDKVALRLAVERLLQARLVNETVPAICHPCWALALDAVDGGRRGAWSVAAAARWSSARVERRVRPCGKKKTAFLLSLVCETMIWQCRLGTNVRETGERKEGRKGRSRVRTARRLAGVGRLAQSPRHLLWLERQPRLAVKKLRAEALLHRVAAALIEVRC